MTPRITTTDTTLLDALADVWTDTPEWEPIYVIYGDLASMIRDDRCRDCGTKVRWMNAGGARPGLGSFQLCDACADIDDCRLVCCTPIAERRPAPLLHEREESAHCDCGWWAFLDHFTDDGEWQPYTPEEVTDMLAEHAQPRHVSHWGKAHPPEKHDELVRAQAKRRAAYWKQVAA